MNTRTRIIFSCLLIFSVLSARGTAFEPKSLNEVKDVIIKAKEEKQKIRFVGTAYSNNGLAKSDGFVVSTKNFNHILEVDEKNKTVRVESGIIIKDLLAYLANNFNLTLPNQSMFLYQTLGGALSTATHGSGNKILYSDSVISYELIDGNGQIHTITRDNPDDFAAVSSNLGALGFVYAVTLQCVPVFILKHERFIQDWQTTKNMYRELFEKHDHTYVALHADSRQVLVFVWDKSDVKQPTHNRLFYWYEKMSIGSTATHIGCYLKKLSPTLLNKVVKANFYSRRMPVHFKYNYETLSFIPAYSLKDKFREMEFAVDFNDFPQVVDAILEIYEKHKKAGQQPVALINSRFCSQSSNCMLSPHFDRTTAYISISSTGSAHDDELFYRDVEHYMKSIKARPHWGKRHNYDYHDFIQVYGPQLEKFNEIRKKFDPQGLFENSYIVNCLTDHSN